MKLVVNPIFFYTIESEPLYVLFCAPEHSIFVDNLLNTSSGVLKLRAFLGLLFSISFHPFHILGSRI
ncbi:hypothetical protein [Candidatus Rhabdochlamydia sp. W815]|uniref:hypothetical protein n=1 Tax=Candidatus Rhabdochlamydia sp. W815 TaxID=2720721 RepID=UPI001BFC6F47|nr:hypothetical protein [Candidatus Rhabdochlamydia sp. W815]